MGVGQAIKAGKAEVTLGLNRNPLAKGLAAAEAALKGFGSQLIGIGASITAVSAALATPFVAVAKTFADYGSALNDAAAQTGAGAQALAVLDYAAAQTGGTFEQVVSAINKLNKSLSGIDEEAKATHVALAALGLDIGTLRQLKPEQQFGRIADRLALVEVAADRTRIAMGLFGRGGAALLPLLTQGRNGLEEFAAKAQRMGLVLDDSAVASADALGDALDDVKSALKGASVQAGAALAPALTGIANATRDVISQVTEWVTKNQDLVQGLAATLAGVFVVGAGVTALGVSFVAAGAVIGGISTVLATVGAAISALLTPLGLLGVGLAAGGAAFVRFAATGNDAFVELGDTATTALGGIRDAIAAGDINTAWEIVTTAMTLVWEQTKNTLINAWTKVKTSLASIMIDLVAGLQSAWVDFTSFFQQTWNDAVNFAYLGFESFVAGLKNSWAAIANYFAKTLNYLRGLFDDTFDVKRANAALDELRKQRETNTANDLAGKFEAANKSQENRSAEIENNRKQRQAEIEAANTATQEQLGQMAEQAANPLAARIAELRATLAQQTAKATEARQSIAELDKKVIEQRADVPNPVAGDPAKLTAQGTFNAFAVAGFGGNGAMDRTAKATEETARLLKRMSNRESEGIVLA